MVNTDTVIEFRRSLRHFEREIQTRNNSHCCMGVTLTQCHTLLELDKEDKVSLKKLSERLFLDKSTTSRIVEGLVNLGLVKRVIPKNDRRSVAISLTKQGFAVCENINSDNNAFFDKVLDSLPGEQLPLFLESFESIVNRMIELNNEESAC